MKTKIKASPATRRELRFLGMRIRESRLRRELSQRLIAERASISVHTLGRIEGGDPSTSIGAYAMVLQALGLIEGWGNVRDVLGEELAEEQLRKRAPKEIL
ncbi:MAG: transcriptional regulator with XRE-family HTH domain [Paracoccaceae bacterium]|jgi:transcriptional regulator with XRE-family HTH domain